MSDTLNLQLPYLAASQAQKHVTHNEALTLLDGLVQAGVKSRALAAPPAIPTDGDRYLVAASPTGAWSGQAGKFALFMDGNWRFLAPVEGWTLWVDDEDELLSFDGTTWVGSGSPTELQNLSLLGVNATADSGNKLTVASASALFNHIGNGHQVKINKSAAGDTASVLYQTGFSGRAEFGTTGDDDFHVKVSSDGATFHEALVVTVSSGLVTAKKTLRLEPQVADPASPINGQLWYNSTSNSFRKHQNGATSDLDSAGGGGSAWGGITGTLSTQTDLQAALDAKSTNGHMHALANVSDVTVTVANLNALDDGVNTALHFHDADRARANHTGTQLAATISDFTTAADARVSAGVATHEGLADPHPQYLTPTEGNAAYSTLGHTHLLANITDVTMAVANLNALDDGVNTALHFHDADRARVNHTGTQLANTISDFTTAADARVNAGIAAHEGLADPHSQYLTIAEGSASYSALGHSHSGLAPVGGSINQVLKKNSATDFDYSWAADATGGGGLSDADYGDITVSGGATVFTIDNDVVSNAKAADMATATIKGRVAAATGDPEDLTGTQATTLLDVFTSGLKGLAPSSGGGTTNFLRADGTWAAPSGGGGVSDGDKGDVVVASSGSVWTVDIAGQTEDTSPAFDDFMLTDDTSAGTRKKVKGENIRKLYEGSVRLASDFVTGSATLVAVTGMTFTAAANTEYIIEAIGTFQTVATTTGMGAALDIPSGDIIGQVFVSNGSLSNSVLQQNADNAISGVSSAVQTANLNMPFTAKWWLKTGGTGGTVQLTFRTEIASSNATLKAAAGGTPGTLMTWRKV